MEVFFRKELRNVEVKTQKALFSEDFATIYGKTQPGLPIQEQKNIYLNKHVNKHVCQFSCSSLKIKENLTPQIFPLKSTGLNGHELHFCFVTSRVILKLAVSLGRDS